MTITRGDIGNSGGTGVVSGSGAANQVTLWSGASTLVGNAGYTWSGSGDAFRPIAPGYEAYWGNFYGPAADSQVSSAGGGFTNQPAGDTVSLVSDNAADVAVQVTILGVLAGADATENVMLNGVTPVVSVGTYDKVLALVVSSGTALGTITASETSGGLTITTIVPPATSAGLQTFAAVEGYGKVFNVVASGATTKTIGVGGYAIGGAPQRTPVVLTGTTSVATSTTWDSAVQFYLGDLEAGRTVTLSATHGFDFDQLIVAPLFVGPATALDTTGAAVDVSAAAPGVAGNVLTLADATHATWAAPSGGVTGSGAANQVTLWTAPTVVGGDPDLVYEDYSSSIGSYALASPAVVTQFIAAPSATPLYIECLQPAVAPAGAVGGSTIAITAGDATAGVAVGAAQGGALTLAGGDAARNTSGNAAGGNVSLAPGAGIGTGAAGSVVLGGNTIFLTDNTNDLGASGATRPRTGYFGTSLFSPRAFLGSLTTADALADNWIGTSATTQKGLVIQGNAGQSASMFEIQDSTGALFVQQRLGSGGSFFATLVAGKYNSTIGTSLAALNAAATVYRTWLNAGDVGTVRTASGGVYGWDSTTDLTGSLDLGVSRSAAGILAIGNGTASNASAWFNYGGVSRVTGNVTNATAAMANITGLSATLVAGRKYVGEMVVKCDNSTAAEGINFDFDGGAATMTSFAACSSILTGGASVPTNEVSGALATDFTYTTITGETWVVFKITMVCNAAGTFIPRFSENTSAAGTATVYLGSYLQLVDSAT